MRKIEKDYEINGISDTSFILEELYRNPDYTISAILETRNDGFGNKSQNPADLKFQFRPYYSNWVQQVSQKETLFDENGLNPLTTNQIFHYENSRNYLLTKTETADSEGNMITNETFYPDDISGENGLDGGALSSEAYGAIDKMKYDGENFRVGQPIQVETTLNGKKTVRRTNFLESLTTGLILPNTVQTAKDANALEARMIYHDYDTKGKILEVSKPNGSHSYYVWGYSGEYAIAKIENAAYEDMSPEQLVRITDAETASDSDDDRTIDTFTSDGTRIYVDNEGTLREKQDLLRAAFPDTMVSTYTYDPLIGVTSMTDPRGYTIYYEYDGLNRLKVVRDTDGNLVSDYEYAYKQPISN